MDIIEEEPQNDSGLVRDNSNSNSNAPPQLQNIYPTIVNEVYPQRSLLVLSKGMRSPQLLAHLLSKYAGAKESSLTLLLNFKKEEIPAINEQIAALKLGNLRIRQITNETTAKRTALYLSGGIYTVSNVILVMDLLQRAISPSIITSVFFSNAEKIDKIMNDEAWIATMIRQENKNLKTLAITDNIEVLASNQGYRKVMQALYLEYCSVWPLTRYEILKDLPSSSDFYSYENHIKLPSPIKRLQKAIMNVTRNCIDEFNRRYKDRNKGEDILKEQDVFNAPLQTLFYKMKAIAGKFNLSGQQILRDIYEFRMLLVHIIYCDAVEFYGKVLHLRNTASFESIWYIGDNQTMECIEDLLKLSKQRVFKIKREISMSGQSNRRFVNQDSRSNMMEDSLFDPTDSMRTVLFEEEEEKEEKEEKKEEEVAPKDDETENNLLDLVKNPITHKGATYNLELRINVNFKFKALIEVLKTMTEKDKANGHAQNPGKRKIIWIWAQDEKKVNKLKDLLTSFFSKKDEHKVKLLLRLQYLLEDMGVSKKVSRPAAPAQEEYFEESYRPNKQKKNQKSREDEVEKHILKKLNEDLNQLKKEYDHKIMVNLFKSDEQQIEELIKSQKSENSQSKSMAGGANENELVTMLEPKRKLKRKFYDVEDEEDEELKEVFKKVDEPLPVAAAVENEIVEQSNNFDQPALNAEAWDMPVEEEQPVETSNSNTKKVLTVEAEQELSNPKKYEYSILNYEKVDLNSFYSYDDSGQVIFDTELIPGYRIFVNCLGSTAERVSFMTRNQPEAIIFFEPLPSLIREIMLEKRCSQFQGGKCAVKEVHTLIVQNSIETAQYLDSVQRENTAFVNLLNDRSSLPVLDDNPESRIKKIIYQKTLSTRVGKGLGHSALLKSRPIIIIDKREFNSPIPARLFHDGFWVIPILLEKGDYVLSESIVVERKCVETNDLLNSMRSGRLENQIKNLCLTYRRPVLLIEFSEGVEFSIESVEINRLQHNRNWVNDFDSDKTEINKSNVKYGLALLCMKYPKLTILWSKSPEYTSKLFQKLKEGKTDPNPKDFGQYQEESEKNNENDPFARHMANNNEDAESKLTF